MGPNRLILPSLESSVANVLDAEAVLHSAQEPVSNVNCIRPGQRNKHILCAYSLDLRFVLKNACHYEE